LRQQLRQRWRLRQQLRQRWRLRQQLRQRWRLRQQQRRLRRMLTDRIPFFATTRLAARRQDVQHMAKCRRDKSSMFGSYDAEMYAAKIAT